MRRHLGASLIQSAVPADPVTGLSSADLLARFADARDEDAFAELVRRYGRMVFAACRRGAGHPQDAEDAFQAVFLVLARKAGRVGRPDALGNWLYGVAVRVAGRARRSAVRRARREATAAELPDHGVEAPEPAADLLPVVERELAAVPVRYRQAVELCDLDGLTRAEAAEALGVPEGTVSSRLTTGRRLLAARLTRRGVTLGAAGLAAAPAADAARLVGPTVGRVLGDGVNDHVRGLARLGGVDMGVWARWAAVLTAAGATVGGVAAWGGRPADDPAPPPAAKEPPKEVAKAPEPAAKAARPGRPRMTRWISFGGGGLLAGWSADGKQLAVIIPNGVRAYDADLKPVGVYAAGEPPIVLGYRSAEPVLVTFQTTVGGRINREEVLQFWTAPGSGAGVPPSGQVPLHGVGRPVSLVDGGKAVLTQDAVFRREPNAPRGTGPGPAGVVLQVVDATSGEVIWEAAKFDPGRRFTFRVAPDGKGMVVLALDPDAVRLERWDLTTGERRWAKVLLPRRPGSPDVLASEPPAFSPDGATIAVAVPRPPKPGTKPAAGTMPPAAGRRDEPAPLDYDGCELRQFAAADGAERGAPIGPDEYETYPLQFSHDGRLLLGCRRGGNSVGESLTIWDAKSGRVLKAWDGPASALFAPDRPTLAILEDTTTHDGQKFVPSAVLALWDVSELVK